MYSLADPAPAGPVAMLRHALADCGRHIPEVLDSAVGTNRTEVPLHLVWEHAYESPAAYRRYMVHPFHASVIDRFVLADSPERVTGHNDLGLGLFGYTCPGSDYYLADGIRRLVLLDLREATAGEVAAIGGLAATTAGPAVSVFAPNTMAATWFDGETPVGGTPEWTHLWEQGFEDDAALEDHLGRDGAAAEAERTGWRSVPGVSRAIELRYRIEPGWGYGRARD